MIFVVLGREPGLVGSVLLADIVAKSYAIDLGAYPRWLVVLVGTLVAALVVWILIKVMKLALWLLFFAVLIGGTLWAGYLLINHPR